MIKFQVAQHCPSANFMHEHLEVSRAFFKSYGMIRQTVLDHSLSLSLSLITSDKIFSAANFGVSVCRFVCNQILLLNIN